MRQRRKMKKVLLSDIAKRTGYSVNTVSHALRDMPDISEATKAKIKAVADEMGYIANASASFLRSGKSYCVAAIVSDISNPHFSVMIKEMESALREKGYSMFVLNTDEDSEMELEAVKTTLGKNVDGIIICPVQKDKKSIDLIRSHSVTCVTIGRYFEGEDIPYVVCDDRYSGYLAAKHLISEKRSQILFLNGDSHISSAAERLAGVQDAVKEAGFDPDCLIVKTIPVMHSASDDSIAQLIHGHTENTGIICFSDLIAMRVCRILKQLGIKIPQDVSIIGFDNIASKYPLQLAISSVTSSKTLMSNQAITTLLALIEGERVREKHVLPTKLALHETTL
jgi:LacI family transcriptional regulator